MSEQPSYFSILTASVRYDPRLKQHADEKILFSEITALSNKYGYCTASNNYFSRLYDRPIPTISKWINHLKELGYLRVEMIKQGKEIKQRKLFPNANPINADINTYSREREGGINVNVKRGINVDVKENNTSINNININNNNNDKPKINAFETLQKAGIRLNGITTEPFLNYVNKLGDEVVDFAINKMCATAARASWGYLEKILTSYEINGITTLEKAQKLESQFKAKQQPRGKQPTLDRGSEINGVSF